MALDMTAPMGRDVPTAQEVFDVTRGSLRLAFVYGEAQRAAIRNGRLQGTDDLELADGQDDHAETEVFTALVEAGVSNVAEWSSDVGKVFDKARVREFIANAVREAWSGGLDWQSLDY